MDQALGRWHLIREGNMLDRVHSIGMINFPRHQFESKQDEHS